jgi:hypothetical protein
MVMRLRLPSLMGRERSWQIPRILESFAKIAVPKTTRRIVSAVRAEHQGHLQVSILTTNPLMERLVPAIARRRSATLA